RKSVTAAPNGNSVAPTKPVARAGLGERYFLFSRVTGNAGYLENGNAGKSRYHTQTNHTGSIMAPFHLAFPVHDLAAARNFYGGLLQCPEGRSSDTWIDFNLYGHQIVAHLAPDECRITSTGLVDGDNVPVRHFGVVLSMDEWHKLADRLK